MVDAVNRQEKKGLEGGSEGSEREGKRQRKGLDRWWRCEKGESRGGEREDGCGGGADAGAGDAGAREGGFGGAARRDVAEEACRGQACVGEAGMGRRDEAGMGRRDEAGMEVASRSARLAWDVFSRGGRQRKVIYLIRHAHTSFSAPPPHTPLPSAPIPLASHLPLSRSASACPSASPPPAPPHTSPPLLPCQAYRHHLRRGHDVPLSPLGRQQLSLFPSQPSIIGPLTILPCPPSFLFLHPHCFLPVLLSSHPPVRLSPSPCPAHAPSAASVAALPCAGDSLLCLAPQHSHRHHVPLLQRPLHHHQHSRPAMLHRTTLLQRTSSSLQLICKTFELDPPVSSHAPRATTRLLQCVPPCDYHHPCSSPCPAVLPPALPCAAALAPAMPCAGVCAALRARGRPWGHGA
ncbi:unnamed protein product [Closterium sp. Naga37s-1]|nr:unnamed protein product [Closterium sp. Naga37s-1]